MTSQFLVWATEWLCTPFTEIRDTKEEEIQGGGEQYEFELPMGRWIQGSIIQQSDLG